MKLIFATSNLHKLQEVRSMTPPGWEVVGLKDIGFAGELPETRDTIEGNSLQKAEHLFGLFGVDCFSEDTGLEIEALNGEPGVYSARYAGPEADFEANIRKVMEKMAGVTNRRARFKTVITHYSAGNFVQFEGITQGWIMNEWRGDKGFGYDPIFKPEGSNRTYAEMTLEEKNVFSHRRKSFEQFANHLSRKAV